MRTVYRVETHSGDGLYRSSDYANAELHDTAYRHPMPHKDSRLCSECNVDDGDNPVGTNSDQYRWLFGFVSIEQLKFWIHTKQDRQEIEDEGLIVSVYEGETRFIKYGDTQAVFDPDNVFKVDELKLTEV